MKKASRKLAKLYRELADLGAVELTTAQEAWRLKRYAEAKGMSVSLEGRPGCWRVYELSDQVLGFYYQ